MFHLIDSAVFALFVKDTVVGCDKFSVWSAILLMYASDVCESGGFIVD